MNTSRSNDTRTIDTRTIANIEDQLREYLVNELGADKAIESTTPLFSAGVLDSFDIVQVLDYVNREFSVEISPLQVNLDNFDSIERIGALISQQTTETG